MHLVGGIDWTILKGVTLYVMENLRGGFLAYTPSCMNYLIGLVFFCKIGFEFRFGFEPATARLSASNRIIRPAQYAVV